MAFFIRKLEATDQLLYSKANVVKAVFDYSKSQGFDFDVSSVLRQECRRRTESIGVLRRTLRSRGEEE